MNAKLLITDSYFNIFPLLTEELRGKTNDLTHKNFVFCEEKLSLMAERSIANAFGGTFNTEVYSFGNFLRTRKTVTGLLSKEGSAMVVKKILSELPLKRFSKGKANLAPSLFELISQLKSAKVTDVDLKTAAEVTEGILSDKLSDISAVYSAYETYLAENGLSDQGSALSLLPEIIERDEELDGAEVFIVGFSSFTMQIRKVVSALFSRAKSCTAILTGGDNRFAFVNETAAVFRNLCAEKNIGVTEKFVKSDYSFGGETIKEGLFNPLFGLKKGDGELKTEKPVKPEAFFLAAKSVNAETERIAEVIARKVMRGKNRYRDFTVIIPIGAEYEEAVKKSFSRLNVPYFLDAKRKPENFPAATLIYAYCDCFYRGLKIPVLSAFFKNPYICSDRDFADKFENYLYKYDICYDKFRKPFTYPTDSGDETELARFDEFRAYVSGLLSSFNVESLINKVGFDVKTEDLSARLKSLGETEDAEINGQVADKVKSIVAEMRQLLPAAGFDPLEFKTVFSSGVSAMEISVIPQYNDAVFVGNFKQAAIAKSAYVFAAGLTGAVPAYSEDVALLTDGDIDALAEIKVLLEPKINVVNHRLREEVALGLSAFSKGLYLSYPLSDFTGGQTTKSEILTFAEKYFKPKEFPPYDGYVTEKQGMRSFARDCSRFASLKLDDFSVASGFYKATDGAPESVVNYANKEIKVRLNDKRGALLRGITSPTAIEDYYSCPYRSFIVHTLKVKDRDTGKVNALSVGNLMHEIFSRFISRVAEATDEAAADRLFNEVSAAVLAKKEFARFDDAESAYGVRLALNECKEYCRKMARWYAVSAFKTTKNRLEVKFGDDAKDGYPAVKLSGGKVSLSGKIDRVDEYKDYFRIIDYKTGGSEVGDEKIFAGVKLQLYLYSLAVTDKTLAGAYYLRVNDEYKAQDDKVKPLLEGKTIDDENAKVTGEEEFLPVGGKNKSVKQSTLSAVQRYVRAMAEQAAKQMEEGVIVPSPYAGVCEYCDFAATCKRRLKERKVSGVDTEFIEESANSAENSNESDKGIGG